MSLIEQDLCNLIDEIQQSFPAVIDSTDSYDQILKDAETSLKDHHLNTINRSQVTYAACKKALICLAGKNISGALQAVDLGLLLGEPLDCSINLLEISHDLQKLLSPLNYQQLPHIDTQPLPLCVKGPWIRELYAPTLSDFTKASKEQVPLKIQNCMNDWPALTSWKSWKRLYELLGPRLVPVEFGNYAENGYTKILLFGEYLKEVLLGTTTGYMAQHRIFDQVPELMDDILIPEFCAVGNSEEIEINTWIGPANTVSPIHSDPRPNILAQIVGSKLLTFFPISDEPFLYLHGNTSSVDPCNAKLDVHPLFKEASPCFCWLEAGTFIFIPKGVFHHVRSLEPSVSVNFWF